MRTMCYNKSEQNLLLHGFFGILMAPFFNIIIQTKQKKGMKAEVYYGLFKILVARQSANRTINQQKYSPKQRNKRKEQKIAILRHNKIHNIL